MKCFWLLLFLMFSGVLQVYADDCVDCHREKTPAAVAQWQASAHAAAKVGCADCHGNDHVLIEKGELLADARVCGRCHQKAYQEHSSSKHGLGLHAGWGCTRSMPNRDPKECRFCHEEGSTLPIANVQCARFLKQSTEMGQLGCNRCHMVENACGSCHSNHLTDLAIVRDPAVCAKCHMGPDHPQWEIWQTSQHGTLYGTLGAGTGPDCQKCHMPAGTHGVSGGITATPGGKVYVGEQFNREREFMVQICQQCHARKFAETELSRGDAIREQSLALVKRAGQIIADLHDRKLLEPMPEDRPMHPLRGKELVLDGQMLYEDISRIERLFFQMKKYALAKTYKGAFHQNPAYTHWYGNAELKMLLVDIQSEALRLRKSRSGFGQVQKPGDAIEAESIESQLEVLQNKVQRGAISTQDYQQQKENLLNQLAE